MLRRRFGEIDHNKAYDRSNGVGGFVGPALSKANYEKFSHHAWIKSMHKINESYKPAEFLKGGLLEHARVFESTVEKRPDYFYDFIDTLFLDKKIAYSYISHGISGIIKAKYNGNKVLKLILKEIKLDLDKEYH